MPPTRPLSSSRRCFGCTPALPTTARASALPKRLCATAHDAASASRWRIRREVTHASVAACVRASKWIGVAGDTLRVAESCSAKGSSGCRTRSRLSHAMRAEDPEHRPVPRRLLRAARRAASGLNATRPCRLETAAALRRRAGRLGSAE
eukprot:3705691-Pleurochrysis_carterae.AAC.6